MEPSASWVRSRRSWPRADAHGYSYSSSSHLHLLLAKAASSSSCFFLPCLLVWTAAGVTVPHVLCRDWTLEPGLSDAGEFEQAPLSGTLYLHVNLSLSRHCYLNSFKDAISQNFFSCITVTWEHFSSIAQSTSISLANSCRWCFVCKDRSKGF